MHMKSRLMKMKKRTTNTFNDGVCEIKRETKESVSFLEKSGRHNYVTLFNHIGYHLMTIRDKDMEYFDASGHRKMRKIKIPYLGSGLTDCIIELTDFMGTKERYTIKHFDTDSEYRVMYLYLEGDRIYD